MPCIPFFSEAFGFFFPLAPLISTSSHPSFFLGPSDTAHLLSKPLSLHEQACCQLFRTFEGEAQCYRRRPGTLMRDDAMHNME